MASISNSKIQIKLLEGVRQPEDFERFRNNLLASNKAKLQEFLDKHIQESRGKFNKVTYSLGM